MVRARGGSARNINSTRKKNRNDYLDTASPSSKKSTLAKKVARKSKKQLKFSEYAKNFAGSDSDSDTSQISADSVTSLNNEYTSGQHSHASLLYIRRPILPEKEPDVNTPLMLPPSSDDLLIENELLMQALHVYEVVRHFGRVLRISPFLFEDFCADLKAEDNNSIIAEVNIALLKALLADDEANQITYGGGEEKDMINIHFYVIDKFTWPEVMRSYIHSDEEYKHLIPVIEDEKFPFVSTKSKLKLMCQLTDNVMNLNLIREEIVNEGLFVSDDHCRRCGRMGDLLCCELCPAVYHLECLEPPLTEVPDDEWLCPVCDKQNVKGVTDVLSELDRMQVYRNEPLGYDRHRRTYWFMSRRMIV